MHPHELDAFDGHDGARELPLERALVVDPLRVLRRREIVVVEQLEPDASGKRHAPPHERKTRLMDRVRGHAEGRAVGVDPIRHLESFQLGDDGRRITLRQVLEQDLVVALQRPHREHRRDHEDQRGTPEHRRATAPVEVGPERTQVFSELGHGHICIRKRSWYASRSLLRTWRTSSNCNLARSS